MKWQVGDRIYDTSSNKTFTGLGTVCEIYLSDNTMNIRRDKDGGKSHTSMADPDIISEEIYNSPLFKVMRETNEQ